MKKDRYDDLISVGKKKGEWDFSIRSTVRELSFEEMERFRAMIIVAIGTMEYMWRDENQRGQKAAQNADPTN